MLAIQGPSACLPGSAVRGHMSERYARRVAVPMTTPRPIGTVATLVANPEADIEVSAKTSSSSSSSSPSSSSSVATTGNVLPVSPARQALEEEVKRLLENENAKFGSARSSTSNYEVVESKEHLKSLVCSATYGATLVVFGSPSCRSCRSMESKIRGLAEQNADVLFAKVNTAEEGLAEVAAGLGVPSLPYFLLYSRADGASNQEKELVSSFTANLSTIDVLRAEISSVKECLGPGCDL